MNTLKQSMYARNYSQNYMGENHKHPFLKAVTLLAPTQQSTCNLILSNKARERNKMDINRKEKSQIIPAHY